MARIIYEDGREDVFNEEDYISKADLEENYISREEVESNYVTREKYDLKKKQAKQAFANTDKAKQEALAEEAEAFKAQIRDEVTFAARHSFDTIPEEIKATREKHPTLSWEEAYQISWYKAEDNTPVVNPNPWREAVTATSQTVKREYTTDELADLAESNPDAYNEVATKIESGEIKQI